MYIKYPPSSSGGSGDGFTLIGSDWTFDTDANTEKVVIGFPANGQLRIGTLSGSNGVKLENNAAGQALRLATLDAATGNSGALQIISGTASTGVGGALSINPGASTSASTAGAVTMSGGANTGTGSGGSITLNGGQTTSTGNAGNITLTGGRSTGGGNPGQVSIRTSNAAGGTERLTIDGSGNVSVGNAALATSATDGFLYIPSMPGAPSGVPTGKTGRVPLAYDSTNDLLYIYNGSWQLVSAPTLLELNNQVGTTYTLQASDADKVITFDNAATITVTVPDTLPVGFGCVVSQLGAGTVSFVSSGSMVLSNRQAQFDLAGQFATGSIIVHATNASILSGDIA